MSTYRETSHSVGEIRPSDGEPSPDDEQPKRSVVHSSRSDGEAASRTEADPLPKG